MSIPATTQTKSLAQSQQPAAAAYTSTPARRPSASRRQSLFPGLPPTVARLHGGPSSPDQSSFAFSPLPAARHPPQASTSSTSQHDRSDAEDPADVADQDHYLLAKSLFDQREYTRAAMAVQHCKGPKARFLCLYSEFLASERNLQQCETPFAGMY